MNAAHNRWINTSCALFEELKSLIKLIGHTNKHPQISAREYLQESMSLPRLGVRYRREN